VWKKELKLVGILFFLYLEMISLSYTVSVGGSLVSGMFVDLSVDYYLDIVV
jgi:hypothetical protein